MSVAVWVLAVSLFMTLYLYVGYPSLLFVLSRLVHRPVRRADVRPALTLVVPVYNESGVMDEKIRNCLDLDYPRDRLEILVASDGSTDATEEIAAAFADRGVRLLSLPRRGKAFALNAAADAATGEILVFTDANTLLDRGALVALARDFGDPEVGGVCGNKKVLESRDGDTTEAGEGLYWRYDKWQKGLETRLGSIFAADGTLHAVRRDLYVPLEDPAQADDIAISTRIVLQGYRLVYEPDAVAFEEAPAEGASEFFRKVRVTNHSVRALLNLGAALWTSGFYSFELLSHKLLRHLSPFFLAGLLVSTALLAGARPVFALLLLLQLAFYALGLAGFLLRGTVAGRSPLLSVPYYFSLVNAAALVGVLSIVVGYRSRRWTPRGGLSTTEGRTR